MKNFLKNKKGQTSTEYALALILCLILAIIFQVEFFKKNENGSLNLVESTFYNVEYTVTKSYP